MSTKVISLRLSHEQTENLFRVKEKYPGLKIDLNYALSPALDAYLERLLSSNTEEINLVQKEKNTPESLLVTNDENYRPEGYTSLFNNEPNVEIDSSLFKHVSAPEIASNVSLPENGLITASSFFDGTSRKTNEENELPTKLKSMMNRTPVSDASKNE